MDALQLRAHIHTKPGVQVGQGLVQKQEFGVGGHGAGNGHALLLAAGQLVGIAVHILLDAHHPEGILDAALDLLLRQLLDLQAEGDVLPHSHVGPEGVGLEHQVQPAFAGFCVIGQIRVDHLHAVDGHDAALWLFQAGDDAQRGGLAAAGRAQQGHEVAVLNDQVDVAQNVVIPIKLVDMLQFDSAHDSSSLPRFANIGAETISDDIADQDKHQHTHRDGVGHLVHAVL